MSESEQRFAELKKLLVGRVITNVFLDEGEGLLLRLSRRLKWEKGRWVGAEAGSGYIHVRVHAEEAGMVVMGHHGIPDVPEPESWSITDPRTPEKIVRAWD